MLRSLIVAGMVVGLTLVVLGSTGCEDEEMGDYAEWVNHVYGSESTLDHPWVQDRIDDAVAPSRPDYYPENPSPPSVSSSQESASQEGPTWHYTIWR